MIIKGNPAGSVKFWSSHLLRDDTNERAEVKEITGLLSEDLPTALREMEAVAAGSRSQGNFMYQANINPRDDEHLTDEQWKEAVDTLERNLGLEGHQRVVIEHVKNGRQHYHIVWNRVDGETMKVADMGGNWPIHEATARELERKFGLSPTPTPASEQAAEKKSALDLYEIRAAEKSGIDPKGLKAELTELWQRSGSGKEFALAVEQHGFILAKGDRRDFCIVDQAGDAHSLARRLDGVTTKEMRARMTDIDRDSLPTVAEARDVQQARPHEKTVAVLAADPPVIADQAIIPEPVIPEPAKSPDPLTTAEAMRQLKAADRADDASLRPAENDAFWREYREAKDGAEAAATERWEKKAEAERARIDPVGIEDTTVKPALVVVESAGYVADTLANFISGLGGPSRPVPADEFTSEGSMAQIKANRRAAAALENIRDSIEAGEGLKAEDVRSLTPQHLENIRLRGDDYVRQLVEDAKRASERYLDRGQERERER